MANAVASTPRKLTSSGASPVSLPVSHADVIDLTVKRTGSISARFVFHIALTRFLTLELV